jgi:hypothetical protein
MIDDENILPLDPEEIGDEEEDLGLDDEGHPKKKEKDLIDDDTVSLDDEMEEELDEDEEDSYDDVDDK